MANECRKYSDIGRGRVRSWWWKEFLRKPSKRYWWIFLGLSSIWYWIVADVCRNTLLKVRILSDVFEEISIFNILWGRWKHSVCSCCITNAEKSGLGYWRNVQQELTIKIKPTNISIIPSSLSPKPFYSFRGSAAECRQQLSALRLLSWVLWGRVSFTALRGGDS